MRKSKATIKLYSVGYVFEVLCDVEKIVKFFYKKDYEKFWEELEKTNYEGYYRVIGEGYKTMKVWERY